MFDISEVENRIKNDHTLFILYYDIVDLWQWFRSTQKNPQHIFILLNRLNN
jgi:hypothetical protein